MRLRLWWRRRRRQWWHLPPTSTQARTYLLKVTSSKRLYSNTYTQKTWKIPRKNWFESVPNLACHSACARARICFAIHANALACCVSYFVNFQILKQISLVTSVKPTNFMCSCANKRNENENLVRCAMCAVLLLLYVAVIRPAHSRW